MKYIKAPVFISKHVYNQSNVNILSFNLKLHANRIYRVELRINRALVVYTDEFNIDPIVLNGNYK